MRKTIEKCIIIFEKFAYHLSSISCIMVFAMMCLMTLDVVMRYIFKQPIGGVYELVENMMLMTVACTYAWSQVKKRHVRVDVLIEKFSQKARAIMDLVVYMVFAAAIGFCAYHQYLSTASIKRNGAYTMLLMIRLWPFYLMMAIGLSALFIAILADLFKQIFLINDLFTNKRELETVTLETKARELIQESQN